MGYALIQACQLHVANRNNFYYSNVILVQVLLMNFFYSYFSTGYKFLWSMSTVWCVVTCGLVWVWVHRRTHGNGGTS